MSKVNLLKVNKTFLTNKLTWQNIFFENLVLAAALLAIQVTSGSPIATAVWDTRSIFSYIGNGVFEKITICCFAIKTFIYNRFYHFVFTRHFIHIYYQPLAKKE